MKLFEAQKSRLSTLKLQVVNIPLVRSSIMNLSLLFLFVVLTIAYALPTNTPLPTQTSATKPNPPFQIIITKQTLRTTQAFTILLHKTDLISTLIEKVANITKLSSNDFRLSYDKKILDVNTRSDLRIGDFGISSGSDLFLLHCQPRRGLRSNSLAVKG